MSELEPSDYSARIAEQLRALGVEAVLIGALAALRYRATPRFTTDVQRSALNRACDGVHRTLGRAMGSGRPVG